MRHAGSKSPLITIRLQCNTEAEWPPEYYTAAGALCLHRKGGGQISLGELDPRRHSPFNVLAARGDGAACVKIC